MSVAERIAAISLRLHERRQRPAKKKVEAKARKKAERVKVRCGYCKRLTIKDAKTLRWRKKNKPHWKFFCSTKCSGKGRRAPREPKVCMRCKKKFVKTRLYRHKQAKFCSVKCKEENHGDEKKV